MKILSLFIFMEIIFNPCYAKNNFGVCDYTGVVDSSICRQNKIDLAAKTHKKLYLRKGILKISKPLFLKDNSYISGKNTVIKFKLDEPEKALFNAESINNINISKLNIIGDGVFSNERFMMPYTKLNKQYSKAIGFTNLDIGVKLSGNCQNININNLFIIGVEHGIFVKNVNLSNNKLMNIKLLNNKIKDVGKSAITVINSKDIIIKNNIIENVLGNMDYNKLPKLENSKFADGIYLNGVTNLKISNNKISNIRRIGIVVEGQLNESNLVLNPNDNIVITNNKISNFNKSRGTENNAGIWVEPLNNLNVIKYKTNHITISNNIIDNQNAESGAHKQYGIFLGAFNSIVRKNIILSSTNNKNIGIHCSFGNVYLRDNKFYNVLTDIVVESGSRYLNIL